MVYWQGMKFFSLLIAAAIASMTQATAQDAPCPAAPVSAMAKASAEISFLTECKPDPNAAYYMYVNSAYWCGPCRRIMPQIIAEYEEMRKDNHLEIILLSHERTVKGALRYMELYSMPFSAVMYKSTERTKLPGAPDNVLGIPYIVVVDAQGNTVHTGHASTFKNWREYTKKTH